MTPEDIRRELERGMPHEEHPEIVHRLWGCLDMAIKIAAEYRAAVVELNAAKQMTKDDLLYCFECGGPGEFSQGPLSLPRCREHTNPGAVKRQVFAALDAARERLAKAEAAMRAMVPEKKR